MIAYAYTQPSIYISNTYAHTSIHIFCVLAFGYEKLTCVWGFVRVQTVYIDFQWMLVVSHQNTLVSSSGKC